MKDIAILRFPISLYLDHTLCKSSPPNQSEAGKEVLDGVIYYLPRVLPTVAHLAHLAHLALVDPDPARGVRALEYDGDAVAPPQLPYLDACLSI